MTGENVAKLFLAEALADEKKFKGTLSSNISMR